MQNHIENLAVFASAGSGKTYRLSLRVIELLLKGAKPEEIVCLTFTNKSAKEMKERVINFIESLAFKSENANKTLIENLEIDKYENAQAILKQLYFSNRLLNLNISTLDAFFLSILRLFSFEAGLPFEFDIATDIEKQENIKKSSKLFFESLPENIKPFLFSFMDISKIDSPYKFLEQKVSPLFEIFGEISHLIPNLNSISEKLTELKIAEEKLAESRESLCSFFISNLDNIDKRSHKKIKRFCESPLENILGEFISKPPTENLYFRKVDIHSLENLWEKFKLSAENYIEHKMELDKDAFLHIVDILYNKYKEIVKESRKLSFSDILNNTYQLINSKNLQTDYLYFRLDSKIRHILIDEFQDTSIVQWEILKPLIDELLSGKGINEQEGSIFYVGDPKQSIYGFRGAQPELFLVPQKQYTDRIKSIELEKNYRCSKNIVKIVNLIFGNITSFTYTKAKYPPGAPEGYIQIKKCSNNDILKNILEAIKKIHKKGYRYSSITILTRKNKHIDKIAKFLKENEIPVVDETTSTMYYDDSIRIILNILKYLVYGQEIFKEIVLSYLYTKTEVFSEKIKKLLNLVNIADNLEILHSLIKEFEIEKTFNGNQNIYRLFDLAENCNTEDFVDFVTKIEMATKTTPRIASDITEGVRIMTVHKSKGLEFEHVIVPLFEEREATTVKFFLSRDNETLKVKEFIVSSNRAFELYSSKAKNAKEELIRTGEKENLNILYVALTRAKQSLFVFGNGKLLEKYIQKALKAEELKIGKIEENKHSIKQNNSISYREIDLKIEKKNEIEQENEDILEDEIVGESIHYAIETLNNNFSERRIKRAVEKTRQKYGLYLNGSQLKKIETTLRKLADFKDFKKLISEGKIYKEKIFLSNNKQKRMDIVIEKENEVIVIDYKLSQNTKLMRKYKKQVEEYCKITESFYKKPTRGYLLFLNKMKLMEVVR